MRKTLYLIIFISIIIVGIYLVGQKEVEAAKVTVVLTEDAPFTAARFNDSERDELIGDISLDKIYVKKLAVPKGSDMYMPGISVALFRNRIMVSEWTSVPVRERGVYELVVGLNEPVNKGDVVSIAVYVNDERGNAVIGKRRDVGWD